MRADRAARARTTAPEPCPALSVLPLQPRPSRHRRHRSPPRHRTDFRLARARLGMNELDVSRVTTALSWTERLTALALLLQSIELLQLRHAWSDMGIWRWALLAPEQRTLMRPLRWLLAL